MAKKKSLGSVKRFGPRYGRRVKRKLAEIEKVQKGKQKCPYCNAQKVKRINTGIWTCKRCGSKFTGGAYFVKKLTIRGEEKISEEEVA